MCSAFSHHAPVEPFTILSGSSSLPDLQDHNLLISGTNTSVELMKTRGDVSWLLLLVTPDGTFATDTGVAARAAPHMSPDWP